MDARKFNSIMPQIHEGYASKVLGIPRNNHQGIDLLDSTIGVEVKFRLLAEGYPRKWVIEEWQMDYPQGENRRAYYWCLGFYELDRKVKSINCKLRDPTKLEAMVTSRTLHIVPWDWMKQFPPSQTNGQTEHTTWNITLRYSCPRLLPEIVQTFEAEKGPIHLTRGVNPKHFNL